MSSYAGCDCCHVHPTNPDFDKVFQHLLFPSLRVGSDGSKIRAPWLQRVESFILLMPPGRVQAIFDITGTIGDSG
jgi:hypothetical protein